MKLAERKDAPARSEARTNWLLSSSNKPAPKRGGMDTVIFSRVMAVGYSSAAVLSEKSTTIYSLQKMFPILMERYSYLPKLPFTARGAVAIGIMGGAPKLASCRKARKERAVCISDSPSTNWVETTELAMMGSEWQVPPEAKKLEKLSVPSPTTTLPSRLTLPDEQLLLLGADGYCGGFPLLRKEFLNTKGARAPHRPKLRSVPQEAIQRAKTEAEACVLSFSNTSVPRFEEEVQVTTIRDKSYCGIKDNAPASYWKKLLKGQEMAQVETIEASGTSQTEKEKEEETRPSKMAHKLKMMRSSKMLSKGELRKRVRGILSSNAPSRGKLASSRQQPTQVARKRKQIVESDDEYKITPVHIAPVLRVGNRRRTRRTPKKATPGKPIDGNEVLKKIEISQSSSDWVMVKQAVELESIRKEQVVAMALDELPAEDVATLDLSTLKLSAARAMRRKLSTVFDVCDENSYYLVVAASEIEDVHLDEGSLLREWTPANEVSRNYHASMPVKGEEERNSDEDAEEGGGGGDDEAGDERDDVRSVADEEEKKEAAGNDEEDVPRRATRSSSRKRSSAIAKAQDAAKTKTEEAAKRKKLSHLSSGKCVTRYSLRQRKAAAAGEGTVAATTAVKAAKAMAAAKATAAAKKKVAGKPATAAVAAAKVAAAAKAKGIDKPAAAAVASGGVTTRRVTRASKRAEQSGDTAVQEQRAEREKLYETVVAKSGAKTAAHKKQIQAWAGGDYRCFENAEDNKLRLELTMSTVKAECDKCSVGESVVECPRSIVLRLKEGGAWQLVRQYMHVVETASGGAR